MCNWISVGTHCVLRYLSSSPKSHIYDADFEDTFSRISRCLSEFETCEAPIIRTSYGWWHRSFNFVSFVSTYLSTPHGEGVFGGLMTRQWKSLFRWYNATILSKHTLESYFCLHMVCNGWEAHKMMCAERIQTFRPICLYFDSNRLRGLRRVPSESARRLIIESSFEHQSRSPTYLNMTCVQG